MVNNITIEVVVNNVLDDAIKACKYPVDRFELVSAIELGGLTPTIGTLKLIKEKCPQINVACMNRPRGGDFVYSDLEFAEMMKDAEEMMIANADGIVFGFLNEDNSIDVDKTKKMIDLIHKYHKEAIFHKASDRTANIFDACELLISLGIDRIMTNGQAKAEDLSDGCKVMAELADKYGDKVQFLFGGGIRANNIKRCLTDAKCHQVHMTSKMTSEKKYTCLDEKQLEEILNNLK